MRRLVLLATAGAAAAVVLCPPASASSGGREDTSFVSTAIGGRLRFEVYLPPGYAAAATRYPVIYVLHGLPASTTAYTTLRFVEGAADAAGRQAIVVIPQAARAGESDPEYVNRGPGDDWETAIATELPHVVDARFRTIRSRAGRALVGISAGGYGAMHLALRHLDEFSVVESWSGYFHPTDPTGTQSLDLGSAARNLQADVHQLISKVRAKLRALPTYIAFYVGRSDWRFYAENETLNQEMSEAGIAHVFRAYPGGHDQQLWQRYAAPWLELALLHLEPAH